MQPAAEWKQMFAEAWRLQRENFWTADMSGIDWDAIYAQYAPLVERVTSRSELSDLFWELQGELNTSHAYEMGGQYRSRPHYSQGFLGVDWRYDAENARYRIAHIVIGDPADSRITSPLTSPGLNIHEGDAVLAINGQRVGANRSPQELLVNQARNEVQLAIDAAELELGVGEDDAPLEGDGGSGVVEVEGQLVQLHGQGRADHVRHLGDRDVLVVTIVALGRRREARLGEAI